MVRLLPPPSIALTRSAAVVNSSLEIFRPSGAPPSSSSAESPSSISSISLSIFCASSLALSLRSSAAFFMKSISKSFLYLPEGTASAPGRFSVRRLSMAFEARLDTALREAAAFTPASSSPASCSPSKSSSDLSSRSSCMSSFILSARECPSLTESWYASRRPLSLCPCCRAIFAHLEVFLWRMSIRSFTRLKAAFSFAPPSPSPTS
mmetsp:Transcript_16105/g.35694  ORF Transcript_16105/g.35694 Transcript_16105/m.35694 type:complete len:207 (-) Transcript_16105:2-622(-)